MDFDRFTRSMLLAQGGFAVFLQAAADILPPHAAADVFVAQTSPSGSTGTSKS